MKNDRNGALPNDDYIAITECKNKIVIFKKKLLCECNIIEKKSMSSTEIKNIREMTSRFVTWSL